MIFVTVGTEKYPFNRLMNWITLLIQYEILNPQEIIVQSGSCTDLPPGVRVYQSIKKKEFETFLEQADLIIAHCGEGTLLELNTLKKPYLLVPRSAYYKEHLDDHQMELAKVLSDLGIPVAWSPSDLVRFLIHPVLIQDLPCLSETTSKALCQELENRFGIEPIQAKFLELVA